ncbi:MAG TPA: putative metal-binding motif-containing protein, partial [Myxococcota bacterium]|nr:putative metal-binding motif-containing protein [Myxococcota bacterium]
GQELCDAAEVDEDCDALINDEDPSLSAGSIPPWYSDADGDSYGDPAASLYACSQPSGTVSNGDDCLDSDSAVHPGATELCNDGLDNNCSGADECVRSGLVLDQDADGGYFGLNAGGATATGSLGSSVLGGDLNGDGYSDLILADRLYDSTTTANMGRIYVLQGGSSGATPTLTAPTATLSGVAAGDRLGHGVAVLPDLDQDGDAELLVGAYLSNSPATDAGSVQLYAGPLSGAVSAASARLTVTGAATTDYLGWQVQPAGDINNDGTEDWAASAYFSGAPGARPGKVGLVSGGSSGSFSISSASMLGVISGSGNERLGASLSRGFDADGDGISDLATTSLGSGTVYLYPGPLSGSMAASAYDSSISGLSWTATGGGETQSPQALAAA